MGDIRQVFILRTNNSGVTCEPHLYPVLSVRDNKLLRHFVRKKNHNTDVKNISRYGTKFGFVPLYSSPITRNKKVWLLKETKEQ